MKCLRCFVLCITESGRSRSPFPFPSAFPSPTPFQAALPLSESEDLISCIHAYLERPPWTHKGTQLLPLPPLAQSDGTCSLIMMHTGRVWGLGPSGLRSESEQHGLGELSLSLIPLIHCFRRRICRLVYGHAVSVRPTCVYVAGSSGVRVRSGCTCACAQVPAGPGHLHMHAASGSGMGNLKALPSDCCQCCCCK